MRTSLLIIALCISSMAANAQTGQAFSSQSIVAKIENCYNGELTAIQLVEKEFASITFKIDLSKNILYRTGATSVKQIPFEWNKDTGKLQLTSCPTCGIYNLQEIGKGKYLLEFKEHSDDCFVFQIAFE